MSIVVHYVPYMRTLCGGGVLIKGNQSVDLDVP